MSKTSPQRRIFRSFTSYPGLLNSVMYTNAWARRSKIRFVNKISNLLQIYPEVKYELCDNIPILYKLLAHICACKLYVVTTKCVLFVGGEVVH